MAAAETLRRLKLELYSNSSSVVQSSIETGRAGTGAAASWRATQESDLMIEIDMHVWDRRPSEPC